MIPAGLAAKILDVATKAPCNEALSLVKAVQMLFEAETKQARVERNLVIIQALRILHDIVATATDDKVKEAARALIEHLAARMEIRPA